MSKKIAVDVQEKINECIKLGYREIDVEVSYPANFNTDLFCVASPKNRSYTVIALPDPTKQTIASCKSFVPFLGKKAKNNIHGNGDEYVLALLGDAIHTQERNRIARLLKEATPDQLAKRIIRQAELSDEQASAVQDILAATPEQLAEMRKIMGK